MPLRRPSMPRGIDMQLYRRVQWGGLATFHMLDTRQYRDDQPCDEISECGERVDPTRSLTGAEQERWLLNGFAQSQARWDVLGQQVFFSQVELTPGPARGFNPDAWDGYAANRDRIVRGLVDSPVRNAVVLTGDVHSHWAAEVRERFDDPSSPVVATELVDHLDQLGRRRVRLAQRGGVGREPASQVLQQSPRLHPRPHHSGRDAGRLPRGAVRFAPGSSGAHRRDVRGARPGAGTAFDVRAETQGRSKCW